MCLKKVKSDPHSETALRNAWPGTTCNAFTDHQGAADHRLKTSAVRRNYTQPQVQEMNLEVK